MNHPIFTREDLMESNPNNEILKMQRRLGSLLTALSPGAKVLPLKPAAIANLAPSIKPEAFVIGSNSAE